MYDKGKGRDKLDYALDLVLEAQGDMTHTLIEQACKDFARKLRAY